MAGPVNLAVKLVGELVSRIEDVKTNHEGCRLLGHLAEQTRDIMRQLEGREFESSTERALELVNEALKEAQNAVSACCKTNFITAILYRRDFSTDLQHAAQRLEHALSLICVSAVEMTSDTQSKLVELSIQLRNAKFEARAAQAHLAKDLKAALERAFFEVHEEREEVRKLVQQLVKEQASTHEQIQELLAMLRADSTEAKKNKERQMELEIDAVIEAVVESLKKTKYASRLTHDMKKALSCPITQELMEDPVMIKESGNTYDRSSITEWFNRGHFEDPLTNLKLTSRELVDDYTVRNLLQTLLGESESSSSAPSTLDLQAKETTVCLEPRMCLEPGLYEGHGKFAMGLDTILAFQLLILEPDGNAIGHTSYKKENTSNPSNLLEIGKGEWTTYTMKLVYEDNQFFFLGHCDCEIDDENSRLQWTGKVARRGDGEEKNDFVILHSHPSISRMIWPSPGMMQIEGAIIEPQTQIKYNSTLVLGLEDDCNVDGWVWFEVSSQELKMIGRIIEGTWKSNGSISFDVAFPMKGVVPNSWTKPTNYVSVFEIEGNMAPRGDTLHSTFNAKIARKSSALEELQKHELHSTPLDNLTSLEYHKIREISSGWKLLHINHLHEFQMRKSKSSVSKDFYIV